MEAEQRIENLIERIRRLMPSAGTWPFTMMQMKPADFKGAGMEDKLEANQQLMFLLRTDFNSKDLLDYISNTAEFDTIPAHKQEDFLNDYVRRAESKPALLDWSEKIVSMGIGMATILSRDIGLSLKEVQADLTELDAHFDFPNKHLKACQLFDISPARER